MRDTNSWSSIGDDAASEDLDALVRARSLRVLVAPSTLLSRTGFCRRCGRDQRDKQGGKQARGGEGEEPPTESDARGDQGAQVDGAHRTAEAADPQGHTEPGRANRCGIVLADVAVDHCLVAGA